MMTVAFILFQDNMEFEKGFASHESSHLESKKRRQINFQRIPI